MSTFTENDVEQAALSWLGDLGWHTTHGPELVPSERGDYSDVVLEVRLHGGHRSP